MIQLIVSDLDGTLLNENKQMTPRTADAIKQLQQKGIRFLLNTEREYFDAKSVLDSAGICCDMICSGGAYTICENGDSSHAAYISRHMIDQMLSLFGKYHVFFEIYSTKGRCILGTQEAYETYLTGEYFPSLLEEDKNFSMTQENYDQILSETHFYDTGDLLLEDNPQILRITSRSNDTWKLDQLRNEMRHSIHELAVSEDSAYCIQVTAIEAQKGAALLAYMRDHRLSLKNTLIIGDGHEDYSMLGLPYIKSVAMGNAIDEIKEICEYQTSSNDASGAAAVFEILLSSLS